MSRTVLKISLSVVGLLVAGTLTSGAATAAPTAGEDGDCAGMSLPTAGDAAPTAPDVSATVVAGGTVIIHALPAGSPNSVIYTTTPNSGGTCIDSSGAIEYFADMGAFDRSDSFKYVVYGAADKVKTGTVTLTIKGVKGVNATVLKKAKHGKKAQLSFVNDNDYAVLLLAGAPNKRRPDIKRLVPAHTSTTVKSNRPKLAYVVTLNDPFDPNHNEIPVSYGVVTTKTGKVKAGNYADGRVLAKRWG